MSVRWGEMSAGCGDVALWTLQQPGDVVRQEKLQKRYALRAGKGFIEE